MGTADAIEERREGEDAGIGARLEGKGRQRMRAPA